MGATHQTAAWGLHEIAWQIPDALYSFASLCRQRMDWRNASLVGRAAARQACDPQAEAWMLTGVGVACRRLRLFDEAIDCLQQALAMHRDMGFAAAWPGNGATSASPTATCGVSTRPLVASSRPWQSIERCGIATRKGGLSTTSASPFSVPGTWMQPGPAGKKRSPSLPNSASSKPTRSVSASSGTSCTTDDNGS